MDLLNKPLLLLLLLLIMRDISKIFNEFRLAPCDLCAIIIPGFLKTGLAKKSTHSTTWQFKTMNDHSKAN